MIKLICQTEAVGQAAVSLFYLISANDLCSDPMFSYAYDNPVFLLLLRPYSNPALIINPLMNIYNCFPPPWLTSSTCDITAVQNVFLGSVFFF